MINLNENYAVTPTGAKTLIIEEGDDWNKVCDKVVGCRFDYIFVPQESSLLLSSTNKYSRKADR